MTWRPIYLSPWVQREVQEAAKWYEQRSPGLGAAFLEVVEQALQSVVENPLRFPLVERDVRRVLLKRFPYGVFFRVRPDRLKVIAILHLYRDPRIWQRRA
jgi:plasmid stabilization system protein ParE